MSNLANENTSELACVDGAVVAAADAMIPATDWGLLRGDGVFEALRVYGGNPYGLDQHLDRLERSAAGLRLPGIDRGAFERDVSTLIERRGAGDYGVRIVFTRGGLRLVLTEPIPVFPERARLAFVTYDPTVVLNGIKSLSYGANMLATRLAQERGFDEALLVTSKGSVLEAPTASIFWSNGDGELYTPPISEGILESITRRAVIEFTGAKERVTSTADLLGASEALLCSSVREIQPVSTIEAAELTAPGTLTQQARDQYNEYIRERIAS